MHRIVSFLGVSSPLQVKLREERRIVALLYAFGAAFLFLGLYALGYALLSLLHVLHNETRIFLLIWSLAFGTGGMGLIVCAAILRRLLFRRHVLR